MIYCLSSSFFPLVSSFSFPLVSSSSLQSVSSLFSHKTYFRSKHSSFRERERGSYSILYSLTCLDLPRRTSLTTERKMKEWDPLSLSLMLVGHPDFPSHLLLPLFPSLLSRSFLLSFFLPRLPQLPDNNFKSKLKYRDLKEWNQTGNRGREWERQREKNGRQNKICGKWLYFLKDVPWDWILA